MVPSEPAPFFTFLLPPSLSPQSLRHVCAPPLHPDRGSCGPPPHSPLLECLLLRKWLRLCCATPFAVCSTIHFHPPQRNRAQCLSMGWAGKREMSVLCNQLSQPLWKASSQPHVTKTRHRHESQRRMVGPVFIRQVPSLSRCVCFLHVSEALSPC